MKKLICFPLTGLALLLSLQMPTPSFGADKKLEVFSWWTSGGEAAALDALFQAVKKADPGVQIINATVAGGGGSAARPVLRRALPAAILRIHGKPIPAGNFSVNMSLRTIANLSLTSIRAKDGTRSCQRA